jgi:hypothetical protein
MVMRSTDAAGEPDLDLVDGLGIEADLNAPKADAGPVLIAEGLWRAKRQEDRRRRVWGRPPAPVEIDGKKIAQTFWARRGTRTSSATATSRMACRAAGVAFGNGSETENLSILGLGIQRAPQMAPRSGCSCPLGWAGR